MVSIEDQKIEFVDYTEPMCVKINFATWERGGCNSEVYRTVLHSRNARPGAVCKRCSRR